MSWKAVLLFCASAAASVVSTAVFRFVLKDRLIWKGTTAALMMDFAIVLRQPLLLLGMTAFVAANILWIVIIATEPMSIAVPVQIGLIVLLNTLISRFLFAERLSPLGSAGLVFILTGVVLLSLET